VGYNTDCDGALTAIEDGLHESGTPQYFVTLYVSNLFIIKPNYVSLRQLKKMLKSSRTYFFGETVVSSLLWLSVSSHSRNLYLELVMW
jgi:hypothetical protein